MKQNERGALLSRLRAVACAAAMIVVAAFALAGCAPQSNEGASSATGDDVATVQVDFTWSETSDCSMCHATEQASFEDAACAASQHATVACAECHIDAAALSAAHEGATAERASKAVLKKTVVETSTCESCHVPADVAAATADVIVLTDENGTVVNPHVLPESADHAEVACTNCHALHASGATIEKKAQRACASCHHANVYECYTCHS